MKKELFIADLKDLSRTERFESTFIVQKKEIRQKKSGDQFLVLRLADRTGWLDARVWDNVPAVAEVFETSDFIAVRGKVQEYNGQFQIIVHKLTVLSADQVDPGDFLPRTQRNIDEMYGEVLNTIDNFSNPNLNRLLGDIFRDPDMATRFQRAPAASGMHHAKVGGLLEHVLSCLQMAKLVAAHYSEIDSDLLASGVLLHDFGKIFELSAERSIEYTDEGRLLGHIAMGSAWLERRCDAIKGFPPRLKILLLHLVLSHHGKLEFGSPKEPLFPEALALHYIDDLDSRLEMMREVTGEIAGGGVWSPTTEVWSGPSSTRRRSCAAMGITPRRVWERPECTDLADLPRLQPRPIHQTARPPRRRGPRKRRLRLFIRLLRPSRRAALPSTERAVQRART